MVDFGMDLQAAIIMFEKPMGLWAILEEESLFPKATDKSFEEKLKASLGKLPIFLKPTSKCPLLVWLWRDHPGQPTSAPKDEGKKKKGGGGKTVSSVYLVSLNELMTTLHSCEPHFVRCLVPNTHKKPGEVEPPLIMHQLTCNGVLEGIRICMRGFPNRMLYPDFKMRYSCLGQAEIASSSDNKTAVWALMDKIAFDRERYRLGHTLVFFRAGALAGLEETRDELVIKWVRYLQGEVLKRIRGAVYKKKFDQRELIKVAQRQFRKYMQMRTWGWFVIIQKTRGLIGLPNPEEDLRLLEEKANATYGKYKEALDVTKETERDNETFKDEIKAMSAELAKAQGDVSQYTERQTKASARKVELEGQLAEAQNVLKAEEASRLELAAEVKAHSGSVNVVKKEIQDLELAIQKVETEKANRDHAISALNDEIQSQDEVINKLNKEKKHLADNQAKSSDDLQGAEEKVSHLNSVKSKLESTLDELESSLEREKRSRATVEKERRKLQGELKLAQDQVAELDREKKIAEGVLVQKDRDIATLAAKLEDEQNIVGKSQKGVKEVQARIEELEEELEAERQSRSKAERQRSDLAREIEDLGHRLDEAGGATNAQVELNKKRENEIAKLRKDMEEANIQHESILAGLKKKQGDAIGEMNEQVDQLQKMKAKIDKDKTVIMHEIQDTRAAADEVNRSKASLEKSAKSLQGTLQEISKKIDEASMSLGDFENNKRKVVADNADLLRVVGELSNSLNLLTNAKGALASSLDEAKSRADNESRERTLLLGKFRNLEHEADGAREALEEIANERENLMRQVAKAETDAVAKAEELEMTKMKLMARLTEAESMIENLNSKLHQVEKSKAKVAADMDEMNIALDQAQQMHAKMERQAKQFDKVIGEWKTKVDSLTRDLDNSQKDTRNASSDLFKVKSAYEETVLRLDEVRRENKMLSNEIKDIMDQISEGGRSVRGRGRPGAGGEQGAEVPAGADPGQAGDRQKDGREGRGVPLHQEEHDQGHREHAVRCGDRVQGQGRGSEDEEEARDRRARPGEQPGARQCLQRRHP